MRKASLLLSACWLLGCAGDEASIRRALERAGGLVRLPAGVIEISSELRIPEGARELEIVGAAEGTVLRAAADFQGRAVLSCRSSTGIRLRDFTIDGNREALAQVIGLPPSDVPFAEFYSNNGLLAEDVEKLTVSNVRFVNVAGFAVLVARSREVLLDGIEVRDSGSRNANGRNNTSGGVLFEEGTAGFEVRDSRFLNVLGNGVWTHSLYTSPRNSNGLVSANSFEDLARDAIQIGHATNVRVEGNTGRRIGYPVEAVDVEGGGTPVAIDTAGNVDNSVYAGNRFTEINGKCIDLDGFHDGEVLGNTCVNRGAAADYAFGHYGIVMNNTNPDMESENITIQDNVIDGAKFGGIFVIGSGHRITRNQLSNLNMAGCNESAAEFGCSHFPGEPDLLQSGIYLGRRAERPATTRGNLVEGNLISGHKMKSRCIGFAPGVLKTANRIVDNECSDGDGK